MLTANREEDLNKFIAFEHYQDLAKIDFAYLLISCIEHEKMSVQHLSDLSGISEFDILKILKGNKNDLTLDEIVKLMLCLNRKIVFHVDVLGEDTQHISNFYKMLLHDNQTNEVALY